jgi:hypothetical protein
MQKTVLEALQGRKEVTPRDCEMATNRVRFALAPRRSTRRYGSMEAGGSTLESGSFGFSMSGDGGFRDGVGLVELALF